MNKGTFGAALFMSAVSLLLSLSYKGNAQSAEGIAELFQKQFHEDTISIKENISKFRFTVNHHKQVYFKLKKSGGFLIIGVSTENDIFTDEFTPSVELSTDGKLYLPVFFEQNWNGENAKGIGHSEKIEKTDIYIRIFSKNRLSSTLFIVENTLAVCSKTP